MSEATTNMSTLLSDLKTLFLTFQNTTLSAVKTYQRGVVGPKAVFPILAMLPTSEEHIHRRSNGRYKVRRNIDIEIYAKELDSQFGFNRSSEIVSAIKDIFQDNHTINDNVYKSNWELQETGDSITYGNRQIQRAMLSLSCISTETMPTRVIEQTVESDVSPELLVETILNTIQGQKGSYTNLNRVHTFTDSVTKPIAVYPAVFVGIPVGTRQQERPGSDDFQSNVEVHVITKLVTKEKSLNNNLAIVEDVKDLLQVNYMFGGKCENSIISEINYEIEDEDLLYTSVFRLGCSIREHL